VKIGVPARRLSRRAGGSGILVGQLADAEGLLAEAGGTPQAGDGLVQPVESDPLAGLQVAVAVHPDEVGPVNPGHAALGDDAAQTLGTVVPVDHADLVGQVLAALLRGLRALVPGLELLVVRTKQDFDQFHQLGPAIPELRTVEARAVTIDLGLVDQLAAHEEVAVLGHESDLPDVQVAGRIDRQQAQVVGGVLAEADDVAAITLDLDDRHLGAEQRGLLVVTGMILLEDHVLGAVHVEAEEAGVAVHRDHDDGVALVGQTTDQLPALRDQDGLFLILVHQVHLGSLDDLLGHGVSSFCEPFGSTRGLTSKN